MKIKEPGGHIDHMLVNTRMHHIRLSQLADMKSNMLLTISSLVLTISASQVVKPHMMIPALIMIVFCLATIVLAAYAAMPKMPLKRHIKHIADTRKPNFNLLFFGDFTELEQEEYETAMEEIMNDTNLVYQLQVKDIYAMGMFLRESKFRFLRLAYLAFICGLFTSSTALILSALFRQAV